MQIGIFGAGAIGCYLGTRLSAAGEPVRLVARADVVAAQARLEATDMAGGVARAVDLVADEDPAVLRGVDVCLVTVKSRDTEAVAATLAEVLQPGTLIVSFQNGLHNARRLSSAGVAVQGIVTYNVFREQPHLTQQATSGKLVIGESADAGSALDRLADALRRAGEVVDVTSNIDGEVAGKLLVNLNNGVCAATGLKIQESLRDRNARRCFGAVMAEGLRVLARAGVQPVSPYGLPIGVISRALALPNFIVLNLAKSIVDVHPDAMSSTLQDLERGRSTEIDDLNGTIVELGKEHAVPTPMNIAVVAAIRMHEAAVAEGRTPDYVSPRSLLAAS